MFKTAKKRRFWRLTALPTTAVATAARGCPWWLVVTFSSFSLLPWPFSFFPPCCRASSLSLSLFSFPFSLGFSLVFLWFSLFLSFLFLSVGFLAKWSNDSIFLIAQVMVDNNGEQSQQNLIWSYLNIKGFNNTYKTKMSFSSLFWSDIWCPWFSCPLIARISSAECNGRHWPVPSFSQFAFPAISSFCREP